MRQACNTNATGGWTWNTVCPAVVTTMSEALARSVASNWLCRRGAVWMAHAQHCFCQSVLPADLRVTAVPFDARAATGLRNAQAPAQMHAHQRAIRKRACQMSFYSLRTCCSSCCVACSKAARSQTYCAAASSLSVEASEQPAAPVDGRRVSLPVTPLATASAACCCSTHCRRVSATCRVVSSVTAS